MGSWIVCKSPDYGCIAVGGKWAIIVLDIGIFGFVSPPALSLRSGCDVKTPLALSLQSGCDVEAPSALSLRSGCDVETPVALSLRSGCDVASFLDLYQGGAVLLYTPPSPPDRPSQRLLC